MLNPLISDSHLYLSIFPLLTENNKLSKPVDGIPYTFIKLDQGELLAQYTLVSEFLTIILGEETTLICFVSFPP